MQCLRKTNLNARISAPVAGHWKISTILLPWENTAKDPKSKILIGTATWMKSHPSGSYSDSGQPISSIVLKAVILYLLPCLKVKPDTCGYVTVSLQPAIGKQNWDFTVITFLSFLHSYWTENTILHDCSLVYCRPAIKDYNLCKQTNNYFVT